jgi:pilus assembly protein FimV
MLLNLIANFILRAYTLYLCILCSSAFSLTLGNLTLYSSLNQPLQASIEILNANNLAANEILPNLASADDFKLANLERPNFLSDIKCEIIENNKNNKVIFISTANPIQHPSIELLIEIHWPEGRMLKEYSLLLTPYHTMPATSITKESPAHKKVIQPPLKTQKTKATKFAFYRTKKGDTLWSIASMVAEKRGISVQQSMDLIFNSNPSAFVDGDKTKLQVDYKLNLPDINNNINDNLKPKIPKTTKTSATLSKPKSSSIDIKNNNQTSKKELAPQQNMEITTSNATTDTTADASVTDNISVNATNTSKNAELTATNSVAQKPTTKRDQLNKSIIDDTPTNYEVTQEASLINTEQQKNLDSDEETTQQNKATIKEKFAAKKIVSPVIKDDSFLNIYILVIIILLICGLGFVLYRKQKIFKNKKTQESDESNDEIIDDYSQVEPKNSSTKEAQDRNDITLNLTPIERAEEFIAKDEPHKAILILNQALSINPEDPDLNFKLTELYCNIKDKDNARKMMANSLQLNNSDLNTKLEALKELFPNLFIQKAIEDEDSWGIDNIDSNIDDMSNEEQEMISDISRSSETTDDLSFLEDSELSAESTVDEIFKDPDTNSESPKHDNFKPQNSKLDLAKGYIDIGDNDEAIKLLNEIITSGTENEQQEAQQLLKNLE